MYALIENGAVTRYPYTATDMRLANPNTSFPNQLSDKTLAEFGLYRVTQVVPPQVQTGQIAVEGIPVLIGEEWTQVWGVRAKSSVELATEMQVLQTGVVQATQDRLDAFARTRNYDSILSLCTYATSPTPKFAVEGQYGVEARDATWAKLYEMLAEIQAGTRPMPRGFADVEPDLPSLIWPV